MDEGTLNDLLECSVCLDRLDTSSKVLPCQHTFCRKCLEEIVQKHKELRCPECRILVNIKIDDLPPNVLLMRILEGMRNSSSVLKKQQRIIRGHTTTTNQIHQPLFVHQRQQQQQQQQQQQATPERKINNKQTSPHVPVTTHQPYAKALYDYEPKEPGDLSFKRGDIVFLKKRIDAHWFQGECHGKQGLFPLNYVQVITPLPSHMPQCKALYDFQTDKHEEEGCLVFKEGDIITVIRRVDENWAEGKLDGRIGIFPLTFVELNNLARSLMKLSTNAQPGPSRIAPPTPTTEDGTPLIPTDHSRVVVVQQQPVAHQNLPTSDSSSTLSSGTSSSTTTTTTTTPNVSSSNTSSNASTAPSSPASPPPPRNQAIPRNLTQKSENIATPQHTPTNQKSNNSKEKRHSFTGSTPITFNKTPSVTNTTHHRHSAEISATTSNDIRDEIKLPANYLALYPYKPQKSDELELRKGSFYIVTERCQDGWYKGTSVRTQKSGVFPGNYVAYVDKKTGNIATNNTAATTGVNQVAVSFTRGGKNSSPSSSSSAAILLLSPRQQQSFSNLPPELPPRSISPAVNPTTNTISSSWHGQQQESASCISIGRSSSAIMPSSQQQITVTNVATTATPTKTIDKNKDRKEKGVGLMRRLTSIKRSKSPPPPSTYSMDNPVFEDTVATAHPVHVRSGSCPSQLLQIQPTVVEHHRLFGSTSQRLKHKERPSVLTHTLRAGESATGSCSNPDVHHYNHHHQHRKSNSLDANNHRQTKPTVVHTVNELFRCEIPYPPNSEYELELQKDDIIYVHKKREDGWYKGTLQRTGRTGLFPASFVRPV